ncbi:hypothetical protein AAMO2058_000975700 [Amorphochlora amoebiformis]
MAPHLIEGSDAGDEDTPFLENNGSRGDRESPKKDLEEQSPIEKILEAPLKFAKWLQFMGATFGLKFLVLIIIGNHIQKGFLNAWLKQILKYWFRDHGGVDAPRMQQYIAATRTPWALKGILGMTSDSVGLFGFRRNGYLFITTSIGLGAAWYISVNAASTVPIKVALTCFVFMSLSIAMTDLLVEARYSEKVKEKPENGSDIVAFVSGGMAIGGIAAALTVGIVIQTWTINWAFVAIGIAGCINMIPILGNFMEEEFQARHLFSVDKRAILTHWRYFVLAIIFGVLSLMLLSLGLMASKRSNFVYAQCGIAYSCGFIGIIAFWILTPRRIAKVSTYFLLYSMTHLGTESACFYFYTDSPSQYPEGPHFSKVFYTTVSALVPAIFVLLSVGAYNSYLTHLSWRTIFFVPPLIGFFVSGLFVIVYLRWNLLLGIPDTIFVVGSEAIQDMVFALNYIPMALIMSHLCPEGLEATMFALLAGSRNMGRMIADFGGAALLRCLSVQPDGSNNESEEFRYLWLAEFMSNLAHLLPLALIPCLIPDGDPTSRLSIYEKPCEVNVNIPSDNNPATTSPEFKSRRGPQSALGAASSSSSSRTRVVVTVEGQC